MFGIDHFNAIINPPESAILAVGRIVNTPTGMPDNSIALRPMMSMTLSIDHRSMDGIQGAKFLARLREMLEQPYLLVE
jgi:pyruvate dehydrogenase E2 component (dihydrolipoamide acetyltransferase)